MLADPVKLLADQLDALGSGRAGNDGREQVTGALEVGQRSLLAASVGILADLERAREVARPERGQQLDALGAPLGQLVDRTRALGFAAQDQQARGGQAQRLVRVRERVIDHRVGDPAQLGALEPNHRAQVGRLDLVRGQAGDPFGSWVGTDRVEHPAAELVAIAQVGSGRGEQGRLGVAEDHGDA